MPVLDLWIPDRTSTPRDIPAGELRRGDSFDLAGSHVVVAHAAPTDDLLHQRIFAAQAATMMPSSQVALLLPRSLTVRVTRRGGWTVR